MSALLGLWWLSVGCECSLLRVSWFILLAYGSLGSFVVHSCVCFLHSRRLSRLASIEYCCVLYVSWYSCFPEYSCKADPERVSPRQHRPPPSPRDQKERYTQPWQGTRVTLSSRWLLSRKQLPVTARQQAVAMRCCSRSAQSHLSSVRTSSWAGCVLGFWWFPLYELHVHSSTWSEAEVLSEYGVVPEQFVYFIAEGVNVPQEAGLPMCPYNSTLGSTKKKSKFDGISMPHMHCWDT
jgi:hypothetical protein